MAEQVPYSEYLSGVCEYIGVGSSAFELEEGEEESRFDEGRLEEGIKSEVEEENERVVGDKLYEAEEEY